MPNNFGLAGRKTVSPKCLFYDEYMPRFYFGKRLFAGFLVYDNF